MSNSLSPSFRPRLEALEARDLPSNTGILLFFLGAGLQQQNNTVNSDFSTLQTNVNTQQQALTGFAALAQTTDSSRGTLQKDFTALKNTVQFDTFILLFSFSSLQSSDLFFAFSFFNNLQTSNTNINNLPGQVSDLGNKTLNFFPMTTINQVQNSFGFPSLTLS
jgi:hypothetical protein